MASKQAQEVQPADIEELLDAVDKTLDRLKTLYEQYFLGIQKQPPTFIHSDVERKLRDLTQLQIRNTGLRYRLATLTQKFGSYNSYWRRTLRQIENGTYTRNLSKLGRDAARTGAEIPEEILAAMPKRMREQVLRDRDAAVAAAKRRKQLADGDVDVDLDDVPPPADELVAVIKEPTELRRNLRTRDGAHIIDDSDDLDLNAFFAEVEAEDSNIGDDEHPTGRREEPIVRGSPPPSARSSGSHAAVSPSGAPVPPGSQPGVRTPVPPGTQPGVRAASPGATTQAVPRAQTNPGASTQAMPRPGTPVPPGSQPGVRTPVPPGTQPGVRAASPNATTQAVPRAQTNPGASTQAMPRPGTPVPPGTQPGVRAGAPGATTQAMPRPGTPVPPGTQPGVRAAAPGATTQAMPRPGTPVPPGTQPGISPAAVPRPTSEPNAQSQPLRTPVPPGTQPGVRASVPMPSRPGAPARPSVPLPARAASQTSRPNPIAPGAAAAHGAVPVESMQGPFPREHSGPTLPTPSAGMPAIPRPTPISGIPAIPAIPKPGESGAVRAAPPVSRQTGPVATVQATTPRSSETPSTGVPVAQDDEAGTASRPIVTATRPTQRQAPRAASPQPQATRTGPVARPTNAAAPPQKPPPGMTDADVNALYAKYVKAKEMVGEKIGPGEHGKLLRTISAQAPKIMQQYNAKAVDFSVVVKDNQVIIRAKPKT